jgi:hypothetical protein
MVEKATMSSTAAGAGKSPFNWRAALVRYLTRKTPPRSKLEQAEALLNEAGFYLRRTPQGLMILPREVVWYRPKNGQK